SRQYPARRRWWRCRRASARGRAARRPAWRAWRGRRWGGRGCGTACANPPEFAARWPLRPLPTGYTLPGRRTTLKWRGQAAAGAAGRLWLGSAPTTTDKPMRDGAPASLDRFLAPAAIAIIGASPDTAKIRGRLLDLLRENGYTGKL